MARFASKVKVAEEVTACDRATEATALNKSGTGGSALTKVEADYRALEESNP